MTYKLLKNNKGAAVVEFSMVLIVTIFMFMAFISIFIIIVSHEQNTFAIISAGREGSINGNGEASKTGNAIDSNASIEMQSQDNKGTVSSKKDVKTFINLDSIYEKGGGVFSIDTKIETFVEPDISELEGDN